MNTSLDESIIKSIKNRHLIPRPRWQFVLSNILWWSVSILTFVLGSIAVATSIFILSEHDWEVFAYLDHSTLVGILIALPYLWALLLALMILVGRYAITHTRRGYLLRVRVIIGWSFLASILAGTFLYSAGFGTSIHRTLLEQLPWYEQLIYTKGDAWYAPDQGLLTGTISAIGTHEFDIIDPKHEQWHIVYEDIPLEIPTFVIGDELKIIGEKTGPASFHAEDIEKWNNE